MTSSVSSVRHTPPPVPTVQSSAISRQIETLRNKLLQVKDFRETRKLLTIKEAEKYSKDSKDMLNYIKYALTYLQLPGTENERMNFHFFQDFMPIVFTENATAAELRDCDELLAEITNLGVDFSSLRNFDSNLDLIKIVTSIQRELNDNEKASSSFEALKLRQIYPLEIEALKKLVSSMKNVKNDLCTCAQMNQTDSLNIFDRDAEPKFLEVAKQTNEAAIKAIRALHSCIMDQLEKLPDDDRKSTLKPLYDELSTILSKLQENDGILIPRRSDEATPVFDSEHPDFRNEIYRLRSASYRDPAALAPPFQERAAEMRAHADGDRPIEPNSTAPFQPKDAMATTDPYGLRSSQDAWTLTQKLEPQTGAALPAPQAPVTSAGEGLPGPDSTFNVTIIHVEEHPGMRRSTESYQPRTVEGMPTETPQPPQEEALDRAGCEVTVKCKCFP